MEDRLMKSKKIAGLIIHWVDLEDQESITDVIGEDNVYVFKGRESGGNVHLSIITKHNRLVTEVPFNKIEDLPRALAEIHACGQLARISDMLEQHLNGYSYCTGQDTWLIDGGSG